MCVLHSITGTISNLHNNMRSFLAADTGSFLFQYQRVLFGLCTLSDLLRSRKERSKLYQNVSTAERNLYKLYVHSSTVQLSYRSIKKTRSEEYTNLTHKNFFTKRDKPLSIGISVQYLHVHYHSLM
jgi:hypothetical protein